MADRTCSIDGCERVLYAKGVCHGHYRRQRLGIAVDERPLLTHVELQCSHGGCQRPFRAKGLCAFHYGRSRKGMDLDAPQRFKRGVVCSVDECDRPSARNGMCEPHSYRFRYGLDMLAQIRPRQRNGDGAIVNGYHMTSIAGRQYRTHRLVMERHLGRPLLPNETVHHRNGQRSQNDLANLELWSTSQPSGQRVEDKVRWALEILALYGPMFAQTLPIP